MSDDKQTPVPCPFCGEEWVYVEDGFWVWRHRDEKTACWLCDAVYMYELTEADIPAYNAACARMRERILGTGNVSVPIAAVDAMIDAARTTQRLFGLSDQHCLLRAAHNLETAYEKDGEK